MKPNDCIDFLKEDISFWEDIINNHALKETLKPYLIIESLNMALNTIQKYQKIEQIVKAWREVGLDYDSCDAMENIERVIEEVEDGSN